MSLEEIDLAYDEYVSRKLLGELTEEEKNQEDEIEKIRKVKK